MIPYEELAAENARLLGIVKALKEENAVLRSMLPSGVEIPITQKESEQKSPPLNREAIIAQRLALFRNLFRGREDVYARRWVSKRSLVHFWCIFFEVERKKKCLVDSYKALSCVFFSGERGIRTPERLHVNSFQDCRNRPLCHLSFPDWERKGRYFKQNTKLFRRRAEEFPVEYNQIEGTCGYAGIGYIENGPEEDELLASPDGEPLRQHRVYQGEVEHIDHHSETDGSISAVGGKELGHLGICGFGEYAAVEETVENIAAGTYHYQSYAYQHAHRSLRTLQETADIYEHHYHQNDAEGGEKILAYLTAEGHPEGHSLVLDEKNLEPAP